MSAMTQMNQPTGADTTSPAPASDTLAVTTDVQAQMAADSAPAPKPLDADWQNLWFSLQRTPWSALAVIPADSGLDVRDVAEAIVDVGRMSGADDIRLLNAIGASFSEAQELVDVIGISARRGVPVVVACDAVEENPATLALAHAAAHTVMVVRLGDSRMVSARKTIEAVGREHVLAAVTLRPRR